MRFVYLIGAPGAGKSTVAAKLRAMSAKSQLFLEPVPHMVQWRGGMHWYAEIGRTRDSFSGTDALAMDIINKAEQWVATKPYRRLFAEGDRLANERFFNFVIAAGYELRVCWLAASLETVEERRAARSTRLGKAQNAGWVKGRETKAERLAELYNAALIDGTDAGEAALALRSMLG